MTRSKAASRDLSGGTVDGRPMKDQPGALRLPSTKVILLAAALITLLGIVMFAVTREATTTARVATSAPSRPAPAPPRPALTAAEEAYARALWPIHSEVKLGALRMAFAAINYQIRKIDRAELRERVEASREIYRKAEAHIRELEPPASLRTVHVDYLDALRLYQGSAAEMLRVFHDGREEHLLAAYPGTNEAGGKLLRISTVLWPGEYIPN